MEFLSNSAMEDLMVELKAATDSLGSSQERMMSLTGTAWSGDGAVKVEVGPRGQLIDIDIDPKVFRRSDAAALKATIIEANAAAVQDVLDQANAIIDEQVPPEIRELREQLQANEPDRIGQLLRSDAALIAEIREAR